MPPFIHHTNRRQTRLLRLLRDKSGMLIISAIVMTLLYFGLSSKGFLSRYQVQSELAEKQQRVTNLEHNIRQLRKERDLLRDANKSIEHVAREAHGMVKPGEIVYRILPGEDQPAK